MKPELPAALVDVFVLHSLAAAAEPDEEQPGYPQLGFCLRLHGIVLERSYLAADGRRMLCHFRAPDAESLRMALRGAGIEYDSVWTAKARELAGMADLYPAPGLESADSTGNYTLATTHLPQS